MIFRNLTHWPPARDYSPRSKCAHARRPCWKKKVNSSCLSRSSPDYLRTALFKRQTLAQSSIVRFFFSLVCLFRTPMACGIRICKLVFFFFFSSQAWLPWSILLGLSIIAYRYFDSWETGEWFFNRVRGINNLLLKVYCRHAMYLFELFGSDKNEARAIQIRFNPHQVEYGWVIRNFCEKIDK